MMQPVTNLTTTQLQDMARVMAEASGALKVILFGSKARGVTTSTSDLDFLLIISDHDWKWDGDLFAKLAPAGIAKRAARKAGFCYPMDVIPLTQSRFEDGDSLLVSEAKHDGIVLFERVYA